MRQGGFFDGAVAFKPSHFTRGKDGAPDTVTPPLSADADKGDQDTVVGFQPRYFTRDNKTGGKESCGEKTAALSADHGGGDSAPCVAFANRTRQGDKLPEVMPDGVSPALTSPGEGGRSDAVNIQQGYAVRRLTPTECCRLQGFPDDWCDITFKGKPATDGHKYRALGNSMAVPVLKWIGERIALVDKIP